MFGVGMLHAAACSRLRSACRAPMQGLLSAVISGWSNSGVPGFGVVGMGSVVSS